MADTINQPARIGWIGTGVMGEPMCGHLIEEGYQVTVFSRTESKASRLITAGATWAASPRVVAEQSDVVFSIVGYPADVRETILGADGILQGCSGGEVVVDMTTSEPTLAREIAASAAKQNVVSLDAPVSGGDVGARAGTLSIMVGGDQSAFTKLQPCFESLGQTIVYQGGPGAGQHTKMVNQTLIATNIIGVCEALLYAQHAGLNLETVMKSVASGAAGSWSLENYGPRIINEDHQPGFYVEHFIKDLRIALKEANRLNLTLPGLALSEQLYAKLEELGHGRSGIQALQLALTQL